MLGVPRGAPRGALSDVVGELAASVRRRVRRAHTEDAARRAIIELCTGLAGELRAGRGPAEALRLAVAALARADHDVFAGLVTVAER
ncbi:MAG: hypothetical protein GEV06_29195, partial [Luteitalea sp.]|nr:hypothetical protein [Luteitalea sp.]